MFHLLCVLSLLTACGVREPAWIKGPPPTRFAIDRYRCAVGASEAGFDAAEQAARVELAQSIVVHVVSDRQSRSKEYDRIELHAADRRRVRFYEEMTSMYSSLRSDLSLEGVDIVERWQDPETGCWFALAVLDRARIHPRLLSRGRRLASDIVREYDAFLDATETGDLLGALAIVRTLLPLLREYELLTMKLQYATDWNGAGLEVPITRWALVGKARDIERSFRWGVVLHHDGPSATSLRYRELLLHLLQNAGIRHLVEVEKAGRPFSSWSSGWTSADIHGLIAVDLKGQRIGQVNRYDTTRYRARCGAEWEIIDAVNAGMLARGTLPPDRRSQAVDISWEAAQMSAVLQVLPLVVEEIREDLLACMPELSVDLPGSYGSSDGQSRATGEP